jgi:glutamate---cysteine ligase / carboxylate-amine ligase
MASLSLFQGYGIEIEYMVVDSSSYAVLPVVDSLLGGITAGDDSATLSPQQPKAIVEWSNELVAHVAEAKCAQPVPSIAGFLPALQQSLAHVNALLAQQHACLMPGAAHPWMNPKEAQLWPHEYHEIYAEYDRIFGCCTHGWTNLQSVHLNLPFANDDEFGRLHAAIRLVLPLIPALAAASPYLDGRYTGLLDARMHYYRYNSMAIPSMTGDLIPEAVFSPQEYQRTVLEPIYAQSAPLDPTGILHDEWANARGAIARFDRNALEIRVTDSQECPLADLAIAHAVAEVVRLLVEESFIPYAQQKEWSVARLYRLFFDAVREGEQAKVMDPYYPALFGLPQGEATFGDIWRTLLARPTLRLPLFAPWYALYEQQGTLASRMLRHAGTQPTQQHLQAVAKKLCACLAQGRFFA